MDTFNIRDQRLNVGGRPARSGEEGALEQLRAHIRKFERQEVDYPVSVKLIGLGGDLFDAGDATIRDMTPEGAFIGNLRLSGGVVPIDPFQLHFRVESGDLKGIEGSCRPVRITSGTTGGFGVRFQQVYVKILGEDIDSAELGRGE